MGPHEKHKPGMGSVCKHGREKFYRVIAPPDENGVKALIGKAETKWAGERMLREWHAKRYARTT